MSLSEKTKKSMEKIRFPPYFRHFRPEKKIFLKIGLGHILNIVNTHLCAKNQKKLMIESQENAKKTGFSGIFPTFSAGKKFFPKTGLRHILGIAILRHCAKNQKKLMSRFREKLVTDRRTNDGQRLIYRTSKVGPITTIDIEAY